jgi:2'-deoxymugineic-acid 2'-dioxygenase / mugineic-acid 3-dioxygenase
MCCLNSASLLEVMAEMMTTAEEFFRLPAAEKMRYYSTDGKKLPRFHTSVGNEQEKVLYWRDCLKLGCHASQQCPDKPAGLGGSSKRASPPVRCS